MITIEQEKWMQFGPRDKQAQELKLKEALRRAGSSRVYRKLWKAAGFSPENLQGLDDLNEVPLLSRKELFEATRTKPNQIATSRVNHWFMGHDNPAAHEWYPYSREDFLEIAPKLSRLSKMAGLRSGDIVLAIVDTPPMISSFIPYLWSTSEASKHLKLEFIIGSLEWYDTLGMTWINFIQKRKPKVVFSSTSNALAFAQKVQKTNRSVRDLLPEVRLGIFYGEQPETGNVRIHEAYAGIERFEGFSPIEHFAFCTECQDHSGIHIWLDSCIPEVLPMESSKAKYLSETQRGTIGELVITNFAKALPIIRYRTGKAVIVQETQSCKCGCNHPKVKFC